MQHLLCGVQTCQDLPTQTSSSPNEPLQQAKPPCLLPTPTAVQQCTWDKETEAQLAVFPGAAIPYNLCEAGYIG